MGKGRRRHLLAWLVAVGLGLTAAGIGLNPPAGAASLRRAYDDTVRAYLAIRKSPVTPGQRTRWQVIVNRFSRIYKANPRGPLADRAMYRLGQVYTDLYRRFHLRSDLEQALDAYRRLVMRFPSSRLGDDAQFLIGQIQENLLKNDLKAFREYLKVELLFPRGDMVAQARERLKVIRARLDPTAGSSGPARTSPAPKTPPRPATPAGPPAKTIPPTSPPLPVKTVRATPPPARLPANRYYATPSTRTKRGPASVGQVQHWTSRQYTRVVIHLNRPADFEHHLLPGKNRKFYRLYIDVHNARTNPRVASRVKIDDGLLRQVRVAQFNPRTVRVVLDLKRLRRFQIFALESPFRIVVDFSGSRAKPPVPGPVVGPGPGRPRVPRGPARVKPRQWSLARQLGLKIRRVIIDAGHGGKDPGANHGPIREKRIVLQLAQLLKRQIERRLGLQVILTRRKDRYLALEARTARANAWAGDVFISLHVNSHPSKSIRGIETYFLNLTTDQEAMRVAARENATSRRKMSDLRMILQDLMLNSKINESNQLARFVQKGMVRHLRRRYRGVRNLGVKQAPFFVLMGAEMPAVLVEIGFISNQLERRRLNNPAYLDRLARGMALGIEAYVRHINGRKPPGRRVDRRRSRQWR